MSADTDRLEAENPASNSTFELRPTTFMALPPGQIKARGWLRNQLNIQAEGLSGNLDQFWPDIKDSRWIGGAAEGWERVPYWLDGFLPLAWLLDDDDMKARGRRYIDTIIANQAADGWICPGQDTGRASYDLWAFFLILKVLVQYEALTGDERIEDVVRRGLRSIDRHIDRHTLFHWGQTRWFECLISIYWLYERQPETWLLHLAGKIRSQGFDWISFFQNWPYEQPDEKGRWSYMSHVVNNAMMLKAGALMWRMTGEREHFDAAKSMVEMLDEHHGMVTGVFSGDECLAGKSPVRGTELCAVAEYMYSLEHLIEITGDAAWGDRLEKITYNALPATFSSDMWTHQYDQQVNQVACTVQEVSVFGTNSGESHIFGLEPNYGCCTANLSQPWPKFALATWMRAPDGFVVTAYAPTQVTSEYQGVSVNLTLETDYPFRDVLTFTVETQEDVEMTLWLRIPEWSDGAALHFDGQATLPLRYQAGEDRSWAAGYYPVCRKWSGRTTFTLRLPMRTEIVDRPNDLVAIVRGPLVYALPIKERWVQINQDVPGREHPHCDYEIHPESAWNYGLALDPDASALDISVEEKPMGDRPFSPEGAPIALGVRGKKVAWEMQNGSATPMPSGGPVNDDEEELVLIPYGCTHLRLTEMPLV